MTDLLREAVREKYAEAARHATTGQGCGCPDDAGGTGSCCGATSAESADASAAANTAASCCGAESATFGSDLYDLADRRSLPSAAVLASLGCGNPIAVAELREGEHVLDLGSGGGIDVLLSARRVGTSGLAYGLDMTTEMLALAEANRREAGIDNAVFLKGEMEAIPLAPRSVDVIISNCVINLSTDKPRVFAEMARVLRPGGRIGISDVVSADELTPAERAERGSFVGCIAGALSFSEYRQRLEGAGFSGISVTPTHAVADRLYSAIVKATLPT